MTVGVYVTNCRLAGRHVLAIAVHAFYNILKYITGDDAAGRNR